MRNGIKAPEHYCSGAFYFIYCELLVNDDQKSSL